MTVRDLAEEYPNIRIFHYKWKTDVFNSMQRDINTMLKIHGYKFRDEDIESGDVVPGEYNDIKGYYGAELVEIEDKEE